MNCLGRKVLLFFLLLVFPLATKLTYSVPIDRIAAVVGDVVITESELNEAVFALGVSFTDSTRREILNSMIEKKLIIFEAEIETVVVLDEEIQAALEEAISGIKGRFPTIEDYQKELQRVGTTEEDLRNTYSKEIRENFLVRKLLQKRLGKEAFVSDLEALRFYEAKSESIPMQPAAVKFLGVYVPYEISESARLKAKQKALEIQKKIRKGEDFGELARIHSDDPASREHNGLLGTVSRGDLLPDFAEFVFALDEGEISIMEGEDAFHILRCDEKIDDKVTLRNIVIKINPTKKDSTNTEELTRKIKESLKEVKTLSEEDYPEAKIVSNGEEFIPLYYTPFGTNLDSIRIDEVIVKEDVGGLHVLKPLEKREERFPDFNEINEELKNFILQRKMEKVYRELVAELEKKVHIEIKL
jgi:parvulin-like peptidyl-prolyl isomerase